MRTRLLLPLGITALGTTALTAAPGGTRAADDRVLRGSAALRAGITIADNGGRDYFGNPVPSACVPDVGAHQLASGC
ncbi:hypothetical protein [Actinomadura oligospora]|uniref:hypothetical protein n=1 Tax=Actinomadura oligospora TaxID=111804 RepID=UPI00047C968C|nr:hypothetical protein [Actinomadura oligospora]